METASGDILAIGTSGSNDKVTNHHGTPGTDDIWLVKTNHKGELTRTMLWRHQIRIYMGPGNVGRDND
jgi:hypothetical protein